MIKNCCKVLILIFTLHCYPVSAKEFPKYKLFDLETLTTDESQAIAINENDQILGVIKDCGRTFTFLWDAENGLKLIELPIYFEDASWRLKLNNKGQIAGSYYSNSVGGRSFIWDLEHGYLDIGSLGGIQTRITDFNDKGQAIGTSDIDNKTSHAFFYDNGKIMDLTDLFCQCVPGDWSYINANSINNYGSVVIFAQKKLEGTNNWITKSYLWNDGSFKMLLPEKSYDTDVAVTSIDDNGNMIVSIVPLGKGSKFYFISPSEGITAYLPNGSDDDWVLRNNRPIKRDCLQGSLKRDVDGNYYFGPGLSISKILVEEEPFYDVGNVGSTKIYDQNSKGYIVGSVNTLYPGYHAFLAISENAK